MTRPVFAYGTLEAPQVVELVLGRSLPGAPARLHDYVRHRLRGRLYPGIVPRPGSVTTGTLLGNVTARDLARLDAFEGELYERTTVEVIATDRPFPVPAFTYVVRSRYVDLLSDDAWSRERFEREWLSVVLKRWRS